MTKRGVGSGSFASSRGMFTTGGRFGMSLYIPPWLHSTNEMVMERVRKATRKIMRQLGLNL